MNNLQRVLYFKVGPYPKKYTAFLNDGKKVHFGSQEYQHYRDSVPISMGGGRWSYLDHNDKKRRHNYRTRHAGVLMADGRPAYKVKYTPAWFSYYYLW